MRQEKTLVLGALALALALVLPGAALGQGAQPLGLDLQFELERLELNPGAEGSLVVGMGELLPAGSYRLSMVGHYAHQPLMYFLDGQKLPVVGSRVTAHLAAAYAPTGWLQVMTQVPLVASQQGGDLSSEGIASPASFGLATPLVAARVGLLTQDERGGLDVALEGRVGVPLGNGEGLMRDESARYGGRLMVGRHFGFIRAAVEGGVLVRNSVCVSNRRGQEGECLSADELGNEVQIGAALATTGRRLRWEFNVKSMVPLSSQPGSAELLLGSRYLVNPALELFALGGVGVGSAPGTPLFRLLVGGAFGNVMPRRGPGESSVNCEPGLPHTLEECPDMDEDRDGVPNALDSCPLEVGTPDRKGCPPRDTDGDGIEDSLDSCPTEPGPAARQGCPVLDQDNDGMEDEEDSCPSEAGPRENRGCPVLDPDKDGLNNDEDDCPNEAGPRERRGCPEEDTDKDGVPNRVDSCISVPGTEDNAGCPEHELPLVAIEPRRLVLKDKVYFEPAQARLQPRSLPLLDWVARIVTEHPELLRVVIGAHTDDRGSPADLRRLSQERAEAVRRYLLGQGVPAERLEARGYGAERPVDTNATSIGRENNRRVEFTIIRDANALTEERPRL